MLESGHRQVNVAERLEVFQSVISRLFNRHRCTGSIEERIRSGRSRKTTPINDRVLTLDSRRHLILTAQHLAQNFHHSTGVVISHHTVRRRLLEAGVVSRRPLQRLTLNDANQRECFQWALHHRA